MNKKAFYLGLIAALVVLDQVTKTIIARNIGLYSSVNVFPGFFDLVHVRNKGAIFGFFSRSGNSVIFVILTAASLAALALVVYYFIKTPATEKLMSSSLALIMAGAIGNQSDRIFRGHVIDFLDFNFWGWHWPSFNVADSCISIGAALLIFIFFFKRGSKCTPFS
jgi:signal peptidase II